MQSGLIILTVTKLPSINRWPVSDTLPVEETPLGSVRRSWEIQKLFGNRPHRAETF